MERTAVSSVSTEMLTPLVLVRRSPVGLVAAVAGLAVAAVMLAASSVHPAIPTPARVVCPPAPPPTMRTAVGVQPSPRSQAFDLLGANAHQPDGILDEVLDVDLISPLAVKAIVLHSHDGVEQWDTMVGGGAQLGVRMNGAWITNPQTGVLGTLQGGTHRFELIASGVSYRCGRRVTVIFVDGTTVTDMIPMTWTASRYPADDCEGSGYRAAKP